MKMRSLFALLLPVLLLGELFSLSNAFATWLQCYIDLDDTEIVMNHKILSPEEAPHIINVQVRPADASPDDDWMSTLEYPANSMTRIHAKIKPPPEAGNRALQWAMDTTEGAKFIAPSKCKGSRTNGASQNDYSVLEINGESDRIQLWAAWAGDHGPVSLTPKITLTRSTQNIVEL